MRELPRSGAAGPRTLKAFPLTAQISDELPRTTGTLYWHVRAPVWNAHVPSGDLLSRDGRQQTGARVQRVRGTRRPFGASHSAL